ncbi:hypothetical protein [Faecalimonas umbilicata]|uniref:hypothetical protein n=1 Tax=Faecalimonas umbilicata TaxID=1912855 RepID=UPI00205ED4ED|nr:hypothetical protein [Faecalimonas umbilicata]DAZ45511.1 MAG TPA: BppU domain protein [Caudoviricetes sp.]
MESTTILEVDIRKKGIIQTVQAMQGDTGRMVRCYLTGITSKIEKVRVYSKKPSGKETYTEGMVLNDYCVEFEMTEQMLAESGNAIGELHLIGGNRVITSFPLKIVVSENPITVSEITSTDDYQALVDVLQRLERFDPNEITNEEIDNLAKEMSL